LCPNNAYDINVQIIQIDEWHPCLFHTNPFYEKQILHDYYCQIVTHEVYDVQLNQNVHIDQKDIFFD
jgi:hypothetical protein